MMAYSLGRFNLDLCPSPEATQETRAPSSQDVFRRLSLLFFVAFLRQAALGEKTQLVALAPRRT
jgi:hypothetical protein